MLRTRSSQKSRFLLLLLFALFATGCVTTSERVPLYESKSREKPSGFLERVTDNFSERECNVGRFSCSFALGPAGEPCECVGPNNVVYQGRTIK
jgi:hypothetical protein